MKKLMFASLSVLALGFSAFKIAEVLPLGATMPMAEHKMKDVSGKELSMKDAMMKHGVMVMFSCNTCPYVVKNQERTIAIADFARKMDIGVILLNSNEAYRSSDDSFEEMVSYAKNQKYNWPYVVDKDHKIADAFGANRTPEVFLFNKELKLVYHGAIDDNPSDASSVNRKHLREAILELTSGKEISVKESRSVGCTIKRNKN